MGAFVSRKMSFYFTDIRKVIECYLENIDKLTYLHFIFIQETEHMHDR